MSIAFERSGGDRIERPGLLHGIAFGPAYDDRRLTAAAAAEAAETSSSSSIGNDSDSGSGSGDGDSGDGEVQSEYKGPLDCLEALEEVLPMKRGMSKFYNGKSKSFASLADVSCSSIKEIVKPENALTRKRKNLIAHATFWDKPRNLPPINSGSISKKPTNSNRSTSTISSNESDNSDSCNSNAASPIFSRPPLHPKSKKLFNEEIPSSPPCRNFSPWRSFSLSDLQGVEAEAPTTSVDIINKEEEEEQLH